MVKLEKLDKLDGKNHSDVIVNRPTPWSIFFSGFAHPSLFGFVVVRDDVLGRFLSNNYAAYFDGDYIKSNGDIIQVQKWSLLNVCKFCLEGFQYQTFLRFWDWKWK